MASAGQSKSAPITGAAAASPSTEQTHYTSDRYARLILAQINKMRLRADFCDVQLQVGGRLFSVHRLVLAASSPYFAALFAGGMSEVDKKEVRILGVEADVFEILLDFIYTGKPTVDSEIGSLYALLIRMCLKHAGGIGVLRLVWTSRRYDRLKRGQCTGADCGRRHAAAR